MIGATAIDSSSNSADYLSNSDGYVTVALDMAKVNVSLRIRELAEPVGINNPYELAKRTGMPYESCRLIWSEKTRRIDLGTIEKLCEVFGVIPGQLFKYEVEPDAPSESTEKTKKSGSRRKE
ncbi:MAG: helix-turn-helix domain-containing protein [Blastocatellia bacterium]